MTKSKYASKKELATYRRILKGIPEDTQNHRVLGYLITHKHLSQMEAFEHLNIVNLPARVYDLRKDYDVPIEWLRIKNPGHKAYNAYYIGRPEA